jgi:hypothetical protein
LVRASGAIGSTGAQTSRAVDRASASTSFAGFIRQFIRWPVEIDAKLAAFSRPRHGRPEQAATRPKSDDFGHSRRRKAKAVERASDL